jgi:FdhD protein
VEPARAAEPVVWRDGSVAPGATRALAEEEAVALTYNRSTWAVMMATPADLEDLAVGFSITEGIVESASEIEEISVHEKGGGIELRMWLPPDRLQALEARRRRLAGPTGCGLCGIESLEAAVRPPRKVPGGGTFSAASIALAMRGLEPLQTLNRRTRAVHAAGLWHPERGMLQLREDVGRHNALDKLAGAAARAGQNAAGALVLLSSRVSVEMVQKAAAMGVPVIVAVSAPTAHAVRLAEVAGITLAAIARDDGFEVFAGAQRIIGERTPHVA